jgi:hypothetical protein
MIRAMPMSAMLAVALAVPAAVSADAASTALAVPGGRHPVGVTTMEPAVTVWYPARKAGAPMRYRDYVELALRDAGPGPDGKPRTI